MLFLTNLLPSCSAITIFSESEALGLLVVRDADIFSCGSKSKLHADLNYYAINFYHIYTPNQTQP